ncbi:hypothetical protein PybrP1_006809 [[Pythium] brassicae (nom. inval.)]|nr:hypothetical protein PybrP1_006809 [[Pythium] brassicae (nom. inval.)]
MGAPMKAVKYKHDGRTTYCYYIFEKYSVKLPTDDNDVIARDAGAGCPIKISVEVSNQLTKNQLVYVKYTVRVDTSNKNPAFEFPDPVKASVVPDYLLRNGSSVSPTALFDIAVSNVVICDWGKCDVFTALDGIGNSFASTNNPNNFAGKSAVFGSQEIIIPKDGKYTGFAHVVVNIGGNSRADFATFFPVQVGEVVGTAPAGVVADSKTTYCWAAKDVSPFDPSINQDVTVRTDKNCPGSMKAAVSKKTVVVDESVSVDWSLQIDTLTADPTALIAEVSTTDAVRDPRSGIYSVVPVSVLSGCRKNSDAPCSSYAGANSSTFDIQQFDNYNLTNGIATYTANYTFKEVGEYLLISRVAMQTTDGARIDMAVYSSVEVTLPDSTSGSVFLYVGLGIGGLILLVGLLFCVIKRRREEANMKNIPFREPGVLAGGATPLDRYSNNTGASSSNFLTHKSPAQGRAVLGYSGEPTFIMDGSGVGASEQQHQYPQQHLQGEDGHDSFSLDPFARPSFNSIDDDDADGTIRPSEMNKFSFQSGYDDEEEWEFDTQRTMGRPDSQHGSEFSEVQRGTFQMQAGGMAILEEDEERMFAGRAAPKDRSTTSSGWTAGHR